MLMLLESLILIVLVSALIALKIQNQLAQLRGVYRVKWLERRTNYHTGLGLPDLLRAESLPGHFITTLLFHEDDLFFCHHGYNWREVLNRIKAWLFQGERLKGGSSITQQVVKNIFTSGESTLFRKAHESVLAFFIERSFSKIEILTLYINSIRFGRFIYGLELGCRYFFDKKPCELSLLESLVLCGIIPSPEFHAHKLLVDSSDQYFPYRVSQEKLCDILRFYLKSFGAESLKNINKFKFEELLPHLSQFERYSPHGLDQSAEAALAYHTTKGIGKLRRLICRLPIRERGLRSVMQYGFDKEIRFLLAGLSYFAQDFATAESTMGVNWERLLELLKKHRACSIFQNSTLNQIQNFPDWFQKGLVDRSEQTAAHALKLLKDLKDVVSALQKEGVQSIALKGVLLAARVYPSLNLREGGDIDLLIRKNDFEMAQKVLTRLGYAHSNCLKNTPGLSLEGSAVFTSAETGTTIDLHWRLLESWYPSISENEIWSQQAKFSFASFEFNLLRPEHELIYLCQHGTKHMWCRLSWIIDLCQFIRKTPIDWSTCLQIAERCRALNALLLGTRLAFVFMGVERPAELKRAAKDANELIKLSEVILKNLFNQRSGIVAKAENLKFMFNVSDNTAAWVKMLLIRSSAALIRKCA